MAEYIEKNEFFDSIRAEFYDIMPTGSEVISRLLKFPAADVEPVRHGEWVYNSPEDNIPYCSECLMPQDSECNFCPSCGAKMGWRENDA